MSTLSRLPHGIKISITRSITKAFEQYMAKIQWNEEKYDPSAFFKEWSEHIQHHASWYQEVPAELKNDSQFHEDLAVKINQVIQKLFSEKPTDEQIKTINFLQEQLGTDYDFSCKAEARFYIDFLTDALKKKTAP